MASGCLTMAFFTVSSTPQRTYTGSRPACVPGHGLSCLSVSSCSAFLLRISLPSLFSLSSSFSAFLCVPQRLCVKKVVWLRPKAALRDLRLTLFVSSSYNRGPFSSPGVCVLLPLETDRTVGAAEDSCSPSAALAAMKRRLYSSAPPSRATPRPRNDRMR